MPGLLLKAIFENPSAPEVVKLYTEEAYSESLTSRLTSVLQIFINQPEVRGIHVRGGAKRLKLWRHQEVRAHSIRKWCGRDVHNWCELSAGEPQVFSGK